MIRRQMVLLLAPLALGGCFLFSSGPSSEVGRTPEDLRKIREHVPPVYDKFSYGPVQEVEVGAWASYLVREGDKSHKINLAITGRTERGSWVEVIEEKTVSSRLVSPEGLVLEAFYRDLDAESGVSGKFPQEIIQGRDRGGVQELPGDRSERKGTVAIGQKSVSVIRVEIEHEDFDGRISTESWTWSKEIPALFAGGESGGLVSHRGKKREIELTAFGTDYTPRIEK